MRQLKILNKQQVVQFYHDGYIVIPHVFDIEKLLGVRTIFLDAFKNKLQQKAPYSNDTIINDIYSFFSDCLNVLINADLIDCIKDIIGDEVVWIPECSVHRNRYIDWHKDTTIQEYGGEISHCNFEFPLIQAAIYFQENNQYGGGLTVIPSTHKLPDRFVSMMSQNPFYRLLNKILKVLQISPFDNAEKAINKLDLSNQLGDLLLFDLRIEHRSTFPNNINPINDKLAVFNTFCGNNLVGRKYFEYMKQRPEPYYKYFNEIALPQIVYEKGLEYGMELWY